MTDKTESSAWVAYDIAARDGDLSSLDSVCLNAQVQGILLGGKVPDLGLSFKGLIDQHPLPNFKALDLGIAAGSTSLLFCENGFDVTGVDISQAALDRAVERGAANKTYRLNLDHGIPEDIIAEGEHGLVICAETLFYLKNTIQMIDDMMRVCAPGGLMAFSFLSENKRAPEGREIKILVDETIEWPSDLEPPKFFQPYFPDIGNHLTRLEKQGKARIIGGVELQPYYAIREKEPKAALIFLEKASETRTFTQRHIPGGAFNQIFDAAEPRVRKALGLSPAPSG